jgi:hypothetical protein
MLASMNGTVDAAITMSAEAAIALPLGREGLMTELSWWAVSLLMFAGAACLAVKWWRSYGGQPLFLSLPVQKWPDFKKWDGRSEFELFEAAALWFDAEPRLPMWWRSRRKFELWKPMFIGGGLLAPPKSLNAASGLGAEMPRLITLHTRIRREVLLYLAEQEGAKPLFLFPERRAGAGPGITDVRRHLKGN